MNNNPRRENKYLSKHQKLEILKEIDDGRITIAGAVSKYRVAKSMIYYWRDRLANDQNEEFNKQILLKESQTLLREQELEQQIDQLKIKLAEAYLEADFLKKARTSVIRGKKLNSSVVTARNLDQFQKDAE